MKKRPSSTKMNTAGLESLDEENQWIHDAAEHNLPSFGEQPQPRFKMPRHSRHGPTPDHGNIPHLCNFRVSVRRFPTTISLLICLIFAELLIETGITQTQCVAVDEEAEMMANNISTYVMSTLSHFGFCSTESESISDVNNFVADLGI